MNFAAGFGAGMGAGIGTGIAIGTSSGRQNAVDEIRSHVAEKGLKVLGRDGGEFDFDQLLSEIGCQGNSPSGSTTRRIALIVSLLFGIAVAGVVLYLVVR